MEAITFLFLIIAMAVFATLYWSTSIDRDLYKSLSEDRWDSVVNLTKENIDLKMENMQLKDQLLLKSFYKTNNKPVTDKEMIDAVKYAMKAAHPDNGGKQEDFIKFNNLYNKIR